jgi:hypothetical protein
MKMKKKSLALAVSVACLAGILYYYDNVKPPETAPGQVIERYFEALKIKDYEKAYAMVSRDHYPDSFNQFVDRVNMYSPDMRLEIKGETVENDTASVEVDLAVPMNLGVFTTLARMDLVRVKREWKIIHP